MKNIDLANKINKSFKKLKNNTKLVYTMYGTFFGAMFPIGAYIFEFLRLRLGLCKSNFKNIHKNNPLLYMIDTAPFFLGFFGHIAGIKQAKALELAEKQYNLLTIDAMTGLQNRYSSGIYLQKCRKIYQKQNLNISVVIINIRNLKRITSLMGIEFANFTVITVSEIIKKINNQKAKLFKISESEFMLVNLGEPIYQIVQDVANRLNRPIKVLNTNCLVELNIGISNCNGESKSCNEIVDHAYYAMDSHRHNKHEQYIVYNETMDKDTNTLEFESELFYALKRNEYFLVYQPIIDAKSKKIAGMEVLIRWNSRKFGIVSPFHFIPILERTNLIIDVGIWIFKESLKQLKFLHENYDNNLFMSINVSVTQLFDELFVDSLNKIVDEFNVSKKQLRLEITESISQEKRSFVRNKIDLLNKNGYKLSIDDFGTGYSSLAELESMPLNCLKVDKSFVDRITKENVESPVIEMIVLLAHKMNLKVVMEGVELKEQYNYLKEINSDYIQGYYFFKPLKIEELIQNL